MYGLVVEQTTNHMHGGDDWVAPSQSVSEWICFQPSGTVAFGFEHRIWRKETQIMSIRERDNALLHCGQRYWEYHWRAYDSSMHRIEGTKLSLSAIECQTWELHSIGKVVTSTTLTANLQAPSVYSLALGGWNLRVQLNSNLMDEMYDQIIRQCYLS